ncbi:MAG: agmatinase [Eubacteriales bacterium]|nr:agmatinase [Eubacteriales bacterium]
MPANYELLDSRFMGLDAPYEEADFVVFGAPFDSTCSFRPGTRFAPAAMRRDFIGLETYSPYLDRDLADYKISDLGDLDLAIGAPNTCIKQISAFVTKLLADNKRPVMIGGEHLLTLATVKTLYEKYPQLHLIQMDAHTDLRDDYLGLKLSHAAVIRRCHEFLGDGRIYQFAIRSGEKSEFEWAKQHTDLHKFSLDGLKESIEVLKSKQVPVYFTLDLDVLDPSVFPGTGTPEPGGLSFDELRRAIASMEGLNLVGMDLMELSPHYDASGVSTAVACKLLREMLLTFA